MSIIPFKSLKVPNPLRLVVPVLRLRRLVVREGVSLVHSNCAKPEGFLAARLAGRPSIWHRRILESSRLVDRLLGRLATKIVVISGAVGQSIGWLNCQHKIAKVYNGFELDAVTSARDIRSEFVEPEEHLVGNVARTDPWKGQAYYIEAAKLVLDQIPNVKFLIVGKDSEGSRYSDELKALARKHGIEDRVIFTGYREDVLSVMKSLDVFVLPSLGEPFGRVLIEAMALEKPVVATGSGGVPEIVTEDTGRLVPEREPGPMADAIVALLRDPDRRVAMGKAGRARVDGMFTMEIHARNIENVYRELLAANSSGDAP